MNKLLVSDIVNLVTGKYILDCKTKKIEIIIKGEVIVYLINSNLDNLNIKLDDNSKLVLYKYNENVENNIVINIYQDNNSELNYNETFINKYNNKLVINNYINGNNNNSNINIRNVCNKENSQIIINVDIREKTNNNVAIEDLKGINDGGFIHIEPNIICDSNEVIANHLTTIGTVDKDSLNYLMSKNIDYNNAKKLLLKGFIFSNMDEYIKDKFGGD